MASELSTTVSDVSRELSLVAMNPEQMSVAQTQLAAWFRQKMNILGADLGETEAELAIAEKNGWRVTLFKSQIKRLNGRIQFYEKCAMASEAGYCLIPNLPCDLFAVRTMKDRPKWAWTSSLAEASSVRSEGPPAGVGEYIDDAAAVAVSEGTVANPEPNKPRIPYTSYRQAEFDAEIDFPVSICKPAIMNATSHAMALKVFDEIGVVDDSVRKPGVNPSTSKKVRTGDPLVIGIIRNPDRTKYIDKRLTFLIGWHIDTRTL